jgi:enoyl-CoA hydratase/carnithine racemase
MTEAVRVDRRGAVAVLTLQRPESANAWSAELHVGYLDALRSLAVDPAVRAVVLAADGDHFCVGADMSLLDSISAGTGIPDEFSPESYLEPAAFPKPLIGAIQGAAAGIGLVHALFCDVRIAADDAVFTTAFARVGLVAEHGVSWLLPQIVGRAHALDLLLSSRRVPADEALGMGLVSSVVPRDRLIDTAVEYADRIARTCSPASVRAMKQQVLRHSVMALEASEAETDRLVMASLDGPDLAEGVAAFLERREPRFAPLGEGTTLPDLAADDDLTPPRARARGDDVAERFFAATQSADWATAMGLLDPAAVLATHPGAPPAGPDEVRQTWPRIREAAGPWEYVDVRRIATDDGFCEEHVVRFPELDLEIAACVVARLGADGRIVRLDEYADGAALRTAMRARREQVPA